MGKRSKSVIQSNVISEPNISSVENFVPLVEKDSVSYNERVNMECRINANFRYQSKTGEWYEWRGAGSVVAVRSDEAEMFLNMCYGGGGCCCGQQSHDRIHIFSL